MNFKMILIKFNIGMQEFLDNQIHYCIMKVERHIKSDCINLIY